MSAAAILGVDWGSSSLRCFRIAQDGAILDVRRSDDGVFTGSGDFETRLRAHLGDWLGQSPNVPILMCGMIGSDSGWVRTAYVAAPAGLDDLAAALAVAPFARTVRIVPGVSLTSADEVEVMRGEETLLMGFLVQSGLSDAILCLPGTHSKWVRLRDGRIDRFRTYMTGELRALLLAQGTLATSVPQAASADAFQRGLRTAGADAALTRRLFQARAQRLLGRLAAEHTASFVSGVLIGEEIAAEASAAGHGTPIFIAARGVLALEYSAALSYADLAHKLVDPEPLAALGLSRIARRAGLIGES